jgi:hypothetical protein
MLEEHLPRVRDEANGRLLVETADDRVQQVADVLADLLGNSTEIEQQIVDEFWSAVDWRLLAEMFMDIDEESSI